MDYDYDYDYEDKPLKEKKEQNNNDDLPLSFLLKLRKYMIGVEKLNTDGSTQYDSYATIYDLINVFGISILSKINLLIDAGYITKKQFDKNNSIFLPRNSKPFHKLERHLWDEKRQSWVCRNEPIIYKEEIRLWRMYGHSTRLIPKKARNKFSKFEEKNTVLSEWDGIVYEPSEMLQTMSINDDTKKNCICSTCGKSLKFNGKHSKKRRGHSVKECNVFLVEGIIGK